MNAKYQDHLAFLVKQEAGARAERYGFVDAQLHITAPFSGDEYEQMRYLQGLEDGKAILTCEGPS